MIHLAFFFFFFFTSLNINEITIRLTLIIVNINLDLFTLVYALRYSYRVLDSNATNKVLRKYFLSTRIYSPRYYGCLEMSKYKGLLIQHTLLEIFTI